MKEHLVACDVFWSILCGVGEGCYYCSTCYLFTVDMAIFNVSIWISPLLFGYHLHMKGHSCHRSVSCLLVRGGKEIIYFRLICCLFYKTSIWYAEITKSENLFWWSLHYSLSKTIDRVKRDCVCFHEWVCKVSLRPSAYCAVNMCVCICICKCMF